MPDNAAAEADPSQEGTPESSQKSNDSENSKDSEASGSNEDAGSQAGETKETNESSKEEKVDVPEEYELKLPEGSLLDAAHTEGIATYAKERGLSNDQAQELLEREHSAVADFVAKQQEEITTKAQGEWIDTIKADKELGGEKYNESVEIATRVVERFGTKEFREQLEETKFGSHPELVRVFARIGKVMSEDQLVVPGAHSSAQPRDRAEILYPSAQANQ